ncbi:non-classical secretion pathway, nce2 component [Purpureocillium lavendulum]|uniref:Non-classical secretion pathway, nce2 component n=1 Tax=Purpureocillium lavendulum TaxID=1247861 RepID=A0AB34FN97_9HYPO|nr:non-classical secretion pathway, nce2 component [Purpureocillium lavendulum]
MSGILNAIFRSLALLWTLLITALIGNVIASTNHASTSANATINFTMFVAALSWVVCLYGLAAAFFTALASAVILLPLDILGVLFTFIDAIVLAAKLRAPNCGNIPNANLPSNWVGFGSSNDEKRCREIQASTAFMWFLWACLSVCLFFTVKESRGGLGGGFRRSGRPNMSQVGA